MQDVILIHTPKTGGTSLAAGLGQALLGKVAAGECRYYCDSHHTKPEDWCQRLGVDVYRGALKICVIRNPLVRAVSIYEHGRRHGRYLNMEFHEFAFELPELIREARKTGKAIEVLPQDVWWCEGDNYAGLIFEELESDFEMLLLGFGVDRVPLPRLNHGKYRIGHYNSMSGADGYVRGAYARDVEIWRRTVGKRWGLKKGG